MLPRQSSFGPRSTPLGSPMVASFFQNATNSPKVATFFGNGKEGSDVPKSPVGGTRLAPKPAAKEPPKPAPKSGARVRPNAPQARDAKVTSESISDFADFIRSTGPPQSRDDFAVQPPPRQANTSAHRISAPYVPIVVPKSTAPTGNRNRLQARDAVVHGDNLSSSELIDFIRQGPPNDSHRIPRTVAPFRTTMDSDQMSTALSGKRLSTLPEGRDPQLNLSMNTSTHTSATANSSSTMKKPTVPKVQLASFDEEDMMPKRKTHRVKDPYAIEYSDDEDDDEFTLPKGPPKRVEESLIDFLNSVPPPDTSAMTSIFDEPPAAAPKKTIMARFSRSNSAASSSSSSTRNSVLVRNSTLPRNSSLPQSASPKKHTPITPSYSTTPPRPRSNYASQVTLQRKPGSRASQTQKPSPREATHSRNTPSNDLADFLMNTPPPPSVQPLAKEQGGFSRMFGRRNKAAA